MWLLTKLLLSTTFAIYITSIRGACYHLTGSTHYGRSQLFWLPPALAKFVVSVIEHNKFLNVEFHSTSDVFFMYPRVQTSKAFMAPVFGA